VVLLGSVVIGGRDENTVDGSVSMSAVETWWSVLGGRIMELKLMLLGVAGYIE